MEMIVLLTICLLHLTFVNPNDDMRYEKNEKFKTYQLEVPGKEPITIIESEPSAKDLRDTWDATETTVENDADIKNLMAHMIYDTKDNKPRCYGPSCQEGFIEDEGPQQDLEDFIIENSDKLKDFSDLSNERLQAIAALAAKLKRNKIKDRYPTAGSDDENDDKVFTSWNRLKVKQHKHPYDDKDGWVTLEPVAWSTSKISKWKPNVKKQKPTYVGTWNDDEDNKHYNEDRYPSLQEHDNGYIYPNKRPLSRPGFINNKLHVPPEYDTELPSKPSWTKNKPQHTMYNQHSSWSTDENRRPVKHNCNKDEGYASDDSVYYGMSDDLVTDSRPSSFPFEYEALHQSPIQKRPLRKPTPVVYAGDEYDSDRSSRPPYGDGQWVLLSTTKGYRNKKRQRSLDISNENVDVPSVTSHQSVSLTVLPTDDSSPTNMTTSHGGLLEVERSFQTVEESKRDMDLKNDLEVASSQQRPVKHKVSRRKILSTKNIPDSSTVLAAVGAGMVPAAMAMVVPMVLGKRRRRDITVDPQPYNLDDLINIH